MSVILSGGSGAIPADASEGSEWLPITVSQPGLKRDGGLVANPLTSSIDTGRGWGNAGSVHVVLINANLADTSMLAAAILPGAVTFSYDGRTETAEQVLSAVSRWAESTGERIGSLSVLDHAAPGGFALGNQWVSMSTLDATAAAWRSLAGEMVPGGDINLFGCDLAAPGGDGQVLINHLADLTGANVFASTDLTGKGGNWRLEAASTGSLAQPGVGPDSLFNTQFLDAYDSTLATIMVTNTNNAGAGSLRQAITDANTSVGVTDTIRFNISGGGVKTISLSSALPTFSDPVILDGASQPGYAGSPLIRLDGAGAGAGVHGITAGAAAGGATIRGLMLTRFTLDGINVASGADNVTIADNWIGTAGTGTTSVGNGDDGIDIASSNAVISGNVITNNADEGITIVGGGVTGHLIQGNIIGLDPDGATGSGNVDVGLAIISGTGNTIGGTTAATRNVISKNSEGIEINTANNVVKGNYIGTDLSGTLNRGNRLGDGIQIQNSANNTVVGGTAAGSGNLIAFNALNGVAILAGTGHQVLGNTIYSNANLGIDLGTAGVTANDAGDGDSGANGLQNFPVLTSANANATGTTIVGSLNSNASTTFRVEFFANRPSIADSPNGEGERYLGFTTVTTNGMGNATINTTLANVWINSGDRVTATATVQTAGPIYGSTSEFAVNVTATSSSIVVVDTASEVSDGTPTNIITLGGNRGTDGRISLREAILAANGTAGIDTIVFNIAGSGAQTITITTALPNITDSVVIDGWSSPNFAGTPVIELNGGNLLASGKGLFLGTGSSGSTIRGLIINRFNGSGIEISGTNNQTIQGNWIGLDNSGTVAAGNGNKGIYALNSTGNLIGGTTAIQRNVISGNAQQGIYFDNTDNSVVSGNYVGTDINGTGDVTGTVANTLQSGVLLTNGSTGNVIGGLGAGSRNVLSGNNHYGFEVLGATSQNNLLQGNYIGTTFTGLMALGNNGGASFWGAGTGNVFGGGSSAARNVISGNATRGVLVGNGTSGATIQGNSIGVGADGLTALGNGGVGVRIEGGSINTLVGTNADSSNDTNERNIISGNVDGVSLSDSGTSGTIIAGNFIGLAADGDTVVANTSHGVAVTSNAGATTIGGSTNVSRNVISGNAGFGVYFASTTSGGSVLSNTIGANAAGDAARGNLDGVWIDSSASNVIGQAGAGNLISGNTYWGIVVDGVGASGNQISANLIGTNAAGASAIGNGADGIKIIGGATNTVVGGTLPTLRNVISGNAGHGVYISGTGTTGTIIQGNYVGTGITGMVALGNLENGVYLDNATNSSIGGAAAGSGNVISANHGEGIAIFNASSNNTIAGNLIGLGSDGATALGNTFDGIHVASGSSNNTIGGTNPTVRNVIASNGTKGVQIEGVGTSGNSLLGNYIGLDSSGLIARSNAGPGVLVGNGAANNRVGGTAANAGNAIAHNLGAGILVNDGGTGNSLLGNLLYSNNVLGIDLGNDGVTSNDLGDGDTGPNNLQNFPILSAALPVGGELIVAGSLKSTANSFFRVEFFASTMADASGFGEGQRYLGFVNVTTDGSGDASIDTTLTATVAAGEFVSATATKSDNTFATFTDTSEFAANVVASANVRSFQEGIAGYNGTQDTYVTSNTANTSYGNLDHVYADTVNPSGGVDQTLLRFDNLFGGALNQIPLGSTIVSARLILNVDNNAPGATISFYRMLGNWTEGSTWNSLTGGITPDNSEAIATADTTFTNTSATGLVTVTGLETSLQAWSNGASNRGWAILTNSNDGWAFVTSEFATVNLRPRLVVEFVANPGGLPSQSLPDSQFVNEDSTLTFSSANGNAVTVSDNGPADTRLQVILSVNNGVLTLSQTTGLSIPGGSNGSGFMALQGTESALNAAFQGMTFTPVPQFNGPVTLQMSTSLGADLVGQYTFDAGNAIDDSVGVSQNGTLQGNATVVTDGARGQVLGLDGVDDVVSINGVFGSPQNLTLAAWVNLTQTDTSGSDVISLGDNVILRADEAYGGFGVTGSFRDASNWTTVSSSRYIMGTGWHHVAYTMDATSRLQNLFIDGVLVAQGNSSSAIFYNLGNNTTIGKHGNGATTYDFGGRIDDARIYTRALSPGEIATLAADNASTAGAVSITVNAVNDAPTLGNGVTVTLATIDEDSTSSATSVDTLLTNAAWADVDLGALKGIAVTAKSSIGTWQYSTDGLVWANMGSVSATNALLLTSTSQVRYIPDANNGEVATFTFRAWDRTTDTPSTNASQSYVNPGALGGTSAYSSQSAIVSMTITSVNDAPVLAFMGTIGIPATNEDAISASVTVSAILISGLRTDVDFGAVSGIAVMSVTGFGTFQYSTDGLSWTDFGSISATNALLLNSSSRVRYAPDGKNSEFARFTFKAWDQTSGTASINGAPQYAAPGSGGGTSAFSSNTVNVLAPVTAVNDAPTLGNGLTVTLPTTDEDTNSSATPVDTLLTNAAWADVDLGALKGIAVTTKTGNGTWQYSTNGLSWTIMGSVSATNALLLTSTSQVRYIPDASSGEVATFTFRAWDRTTDSPSTNASQSYANPGAGGGTTAYSIQSAMASITITAVNDAPIVTASGGVMAYVENAVATPIDPGVTVGDVDDALLIQATVSITGNFVSGQDVLGFVDQNGITGTWDSDSGVLTLSGISSVANYQSALRTVTYLNTSDAPSTSSRTVSFVVSDPTLNSAPATRAITITAINDAPTLGDGTLAPVDEDTASPSGQPLSLIFLGQYGDVDAGDSFGGIAVVSNTANAVTQGTWQYSTDAGTNWFAIGPVADDASALALGATTLVRFVPVVDFNGSPIALVTRGLDNTYGGGFSTTAGGEIRVHVNSAMNGGTTAIASATAKLSTSITPVNDAPVLDNSGLMTLSTITEDETGNSGNSIAEILGSAGGDRVTDIDSGAVEGIAITSLSSGNGAWEYSIDAGVSWSAVGSVSNASALLLRDIDLVRFVPDGLNATTASFDFRAWDRATGTPGNKVDVSTNGGATAFSAATGSASITVTAVNDAPMLAGTNNLASINRNPVSNPGTLARDLILGQVTDPDPSPLAGIAITAVVNTNGAWEYSINGGANWFALAGVTNNNARLLAADGNTFVRFVPNQDWSGTVTSGLTFRAWDQTSGIAGGLANSVPNGGTTSFSMATASTSILVSASNTAPTLSGANNLSPINEDPTANPGTLVSALIAGQTSDVDPGAVSGIAVTAVDNSNGLWEYSVDGGGAWTPFGSPTSTAARLLAANATTFVRFVPNANWNGVVSNGITFRAWDQTSGVAGGTADVTGVTDLRDNFETVSYSNNDGTQSWSTSWIEADSSSGGAAGGNVRVTGGQLRVEAAGSGTKSAISREADLTGAGMATLSFTFSSTLSTGDRIDVQVSNNGGVGYNTLPGGIFDGSSPASGSKSIDISAYIASNTRIRFIEVTDGVVGGFLYVDNLRIALGNSGGGGSAFSTNSASSGISVIAVNDAPVRIAGTVGNLTVLEDAAATSLGLGTLTYGLGGGGDESGQTLTYTVTGVPSPVLGNITLADGATVVTANTSYSLVQLRGMMFKAAPDANGGPGTFRWNVVDDGGNLNGGIDSLNEALAVSVTPVNDAPIASNLNTPENYTEDTQLNLTAIVISDVDSANVTATLTLSNPTAGSLNVGTSGAVTSTYSAGVWTASGAIANVNALLAGLVFTPTLNFNSDFSIATSISDGLATLTGIKAMAGIPVNDAPAGTDSTVTTLEDTAYTFVASDFGFTDPDDSPGNTLLAVKIKTPPLVGTLTNNGVAITTGETITLADLNGGFLRFTPATDAYGVGYARFTFQIQDDGGMDHGGVDLDPMIHTITVNVNEVNDAPTLGIAATATPNPVTGSATDLSVLGDDDGGESKLTYSWSFLAKPNGAADPTFLDNASNTAKNTIATFTSAGNYTFLVTIEDSGGLRISTSVAVTVNQTLTTIIVSPTSSILNLNGTQPFTALAFDQFAEALAAQPAFHWAVSNGLGAIDATGLYSAGSVPTSAVINASSGLVTGSATVTVTNAAPVVVSVASATPSSVIGTTTQLSVLGDDDGGESNLTYSWSILVKPNGAADPTFLDNASNTAKNTIATFTSAGNYTFLVSILDSGGLSTTSTANVAVQFVNETPVNTVPGPQSLPQNTALVFSSASTNAISVDDQDAGTSTIQVTMEVIHGSLILGDTSGLTLVNGSQGAAAMTIQGTLASINAALEGMTYTPSVSYEGPDTLTISTDDLGNTGFGGPRIATSFVSITVLHVNEAPTLSLPGPRRIPSDHTLTFSATNGAIIAVGDSDAGLNFVQVTLTATNGTLTLGQATGLTVLNGGSASAAAFLTIQGTLNDINASLNGLTFHPNPGLSGTASIDILVNDLGNSGVGGAQSASGQITITVGGVRVTPSGGLMTNESGGQATFSVVLDTPPIANVIIALGSSNPGQGVVSTGSLTFTPSNWNVPQNVTITGVNDQIVNGDLPYSIVFAPAESADPAYNLLKSQDVSVLNQETNFASIDVSPTTGLVTTKAGGQATFTVVLTSKPVEPVTVPLNSSNLNAGTLDKNRLTFTPENWNLPQTVTVTGVQDYINGGAISYRILIGPAETIDPNYRGRLGSEVRLTNLPVPNRPPLIVVPGPWTTDQNVAIRFSNATLNPIMVSDGDAGPQVIQVTLTASHGRITLGSTSGLEVREGRNGSDSLSVVGTIDDINAALNGLILEPSTGYVGSAWLMIRSNDLGNTGTGGAQEDVELIPVSIVNPSPVTDNTQPSNPKDPNQTSDPKTPVSGLLLIQTANPIINPEYSVSTTSTTAVAVATYPIPSPVPNQDCQATSHSTNPSDGNSSGEGGLDSDEGQTDDSGGPTQDDSEKSDRRANAPISYFQAENGAGQGSIQNPNTHAPAFVFDSASLLREFSEFAFAPTVATLVSHGGSLGEPLGLYSKLFWDGLDEMGEEMDNGLGVQAVTIAAVTGLTVSVGYVVWTTRASYLLAGLLAATPIWREFDPLVILESRPRQPKGWRRRRQEDDEKSESLHSILKTHARRRGGSLPARVVPR